MDCPLVCCLVFIATLGLLIYSLGNPHIFVFSTKSGTYSVLFFKWQSDKDMTARTLSELSLSMSRFLVSREFSFTEITYNIGQVGDNIGRVGDTIANDSVVMEETANREVSQQNIELPNQVTDEQKEYLK